MIDKHEAIEEIRALIKSYCWMVDRADYEGLAEFFKYANIYYDGVLSNPDGPDGEATAAQFRDSVIRYEDGLPHTSHCVINDIITVDEETETAEAKHYTIVIQGKTGEFGPEVKIQDYKYDKFAIRDGKWVLTDRDMRNLAVGDLTTHLANISDWG